LRRRFNHLSASISESAQINKLDPLLIKAIARVESCFDKSAVSSAGAQGVMQLMPMTAASLGVSDSFDVSQNIHGGSTYFAQMLNRYQGDIKLALAAYNAGPGSVDRFNDIPPFPETQKYVVRVLNTYRSYLGLNRTSSRAL
jgi:soluble lytic murein transglycosylase-like protein